ncbi:MAG: nucleotidyl transferase AbiEii/AbiGii toxin family protein, partial [Solirubrobacteraceae bacterium]
MDELLQLYVLEAFLDRLANSPFAEQLVLKGGVLLAAFEERRATRDIDLQAQAVDSDVDSVCAMACEIAAIAIDDGVMFETEMVSAEQIRDEEIYAGVRVTMTARLASARQHFHIDMNMGDPISPAPTQVRLPRLLGGEMLLRAYPLAMVHAEKVVTAVARGTVNTRWRDFADIYVLAQRHAIDGTELVRSARRVSEHRQVQLVPLSG